MSRPASKLLMRDGNIRNASCEPRVTVRGERERETRWRKRSMRYTVEKSQTSELDGLIDLVLSPTFEPPPPRCFVFPFLKSVNMPKLRVTSEFDSDSLFFFNKVSCKIFDNLAKLKLSFHNNTQRQVSQPQVSFTPKYVSVLYDVEEKNAFVKSTVDVSPRLQLRALHNVKAQQGEQPPEKKASSSVVSPQKIESPIQKLESKFDTNKAFTGSIVEHTHNLETNTHGKMQQLSGSQPSKPVSRFKAQRR
ncbi:unnamed protein product [Brassica napus]|uniref:(rape) hypothetical protein n=1 Tax=Brassica napus TaxID=3708 RepID=A0A816MWH9_BRANA|nr:unnamed protein product [Brassica napus]